MIDFFEKTICVECEFITPCLGSQPNDKELYTNYIASKADEEKDVKEEIDMIGVTEFVEKGTTVFHRDENDNLYLLEHQIKGFLKNTTKALRGTTTKRFESAKIKNYQMRIKNQIIVSPRKIKLNLPKNEEMDILQRPLRASTPMGERVALASSEELPEGTTFRMEIGLLDKTHEAWVKEMLDYGELSGIGQWRDAGYGRFMWREIPSLDA